MWLISGWLLIYTLSIFSLVFGIHRLRSKKNELKTLSLDQLTVVIPFRNEASNLQQFLDCIYAQKYQPVQWIFVNDHSLDDFLPFFQKMNSFPIRLLHLPEEQTGKKRAIRFGMDHATTDYCLTVDADVTFGAEYMKFMMTVPTADLVILPVEMTAKKGWQTFFTTEYLLTTLLNRGVAGWLRPVNAGGANLLIHTQTFDEVDDLQEHEHILSGDDMYTLRAFREKHKTIELEENTTLTVYTATHDTIRQVMDQRVRWLSKTGHVGDHLNTFLGFWTVFLHLYYFLLLVIALFVPSIWLLLMLIFFKSLLDTILIRTVRKNWSKKDVCGLLLFEGFYPIYLFVLVGMLLFSQPEWKGR